MAALDSRRPGHIERSRRAFVEHGRMEEQYRQEIATQFMLLLSLKFEAEGLRRLVVA
jgi:hypothetical protein